MASTTRSHSSFVPMVIRMQPCKFNDLFWSRRIIPKSHKALNTFSPSWHLNCCLSDAFNVSRFDNVVCFTDSVCVFDHQLDLCDILIKSHYSNVESEHIDVVPYWLVAVYLCSLFYCNALCDSVSLVRSQFEKA